MGNETEPKKRVHGLYKGPFAYPRFRSVRNSPKTPIKDINNNNKNADTIRKQKTIIGLFKDTEYIWNNSSFENCTSVQIDDSISSSSLASTSVSSSHTSPRREHKLILPKSKQHDQFIDIHGLRSMNARLLFSRVYLLANNKKQSRIVWCIGRGKHSGLSAVSPDMMPSALWTILTDIHQNIFNNKFFNCSPASDNPGQAVVIIKEKSTPTISLECKVPAKKTSK